MPYRHAAEISSIENCPPDTAIPREIRAYRFVHDNITDDRNFKCISKLHPARRLGHLERCSGFGLSMFTSQEMAVKRFRVLLLSNKNVWKSLGSKLATGTITPEDGCVSEPSGTGHFDLWEAEGVDLASKFQIIGDLPI